MEKSWEDRTSLEPTPAYSYDDIELQDIEKADNGRKMWPATGAENTAPPPPIGPQQVIQETCVPPQEQDVPNPTGYYLNKRLKNFCLAGLVLLLMLLIVLATGLGLAVSQLRKDHTPLVHNVTMTSASSIVHTTTHFNTYSTKLTPSTFSTSIITPNSSLILTITQFSTVSTLTQTITLPEPGSCMTAYSISDCVYKYTALTNGEPCPTTIEPLPATCTQSAISSPAPMSASPKPTSLSPAECLKLLDGVCMNPNGPITDQMIECAPFYEDYCGVAENFPCEYVQNVICCIDFTDLPSHQVAAKRAASMGCFAASPASSSRKPTPTSKASISPLLSSPMPTGFSPSEKGCISYLDIFCSDPLQP